MSTPQSLRVALVSEHYYPHPGGVPEHLYNLSAYLTKQGHRVTIITGRYAGRDEGPSPAPPGVKVVHIGGHNRALIFNGGISRVTIGLQIASQLRAVFAHGRFDVIHVHAPLFPMLPMLAVKVAPAGAVVVGTMHSVFQPSPLLHIMRPYLQAYLRALDGVISVADNVLPAHERVGLTYEGTVIPNGIDLDYWVSGKPVPALSDGRLNLFVLARLDPRNSVELVLDALPLVLEQVPNTRLVLVGDGPAKASLAARLSDRLAASVHFAGTRITDRNDYAASCDVFCFTHSLASQSVSLLEGMAASLPVVCQDMDFTRSSLQDNEDGLIVPRGDVSAYAAALVRLLKDPDLRKRMGQSARRRIEPLSWAHIGPRIESVYHELLAHRGPSALASRSTLPRPSL